MIVEAVDTFELVLAAAIAWAGVIGGALAFVVAVVAFSVGPLIAPQARAGRQTPAGAPESPSQLPRAIRGAPGPSQRRTEPHRPTWSRP